MAKSLDTASRAMDGNAPPAGEVIRGWDRFETALEGGLARVACLGSFEDVVAGGLAAGDAAPTPGRPPVLRPVAADPGGTSGGTSDAAGPEAVALEARLCQMRAELSGGGLDRSPRRADEDELDRLLDDLSRR